MVAIVFDLLDLDSVPYSITGLYFACVLFSLSFCCRDAYRLLVLFQYFVYCSILLVILRSDVSWRISVDQWRCYTTWYKVY